uniref:SDR family NAD(P)-dependent oxidoreductase n=1 Tax=Schlesneria paludicola TaxID=360056 RepID=A0A7C4QHJ8_9PLAN
MSTPATTQRTALVTGTSSGIGRAVALLLDRDGYRVFAGVRKEADAERLRRDASPRLQPIILDITRPEQIAAAVETLRQELGETGGLDALVNNAGIVEAGPLECLSLERLRRQFEVNVFGHIAVTQACLPFLHRAKGRIVTIASAVSDSPAPFLGAYAGSKCALRGLMISLRRELMWFGIEVSVVLPGFVTGPLWDEVPRTFEKVAREDASGRYGPLLETLVEMVEPTFRWGVAPEVVARVVRRALRARWPRAIYRCGPGSRLAQWVDWIPERLIHWTQVVLVRRRQARAANSKQRPAAVEHSAPS